MQIILTLLIQKILFKKLNMVIKKLTKLFNLTKENLIIIKLVTLM
jgi:hypothetical protein